MSEVKRYDPADIGHMAERADGGWVSFEDFELATKARDAIFSQVVESLTAERDKANAEAERWRNVCKSYDDQPSRLMVEQHRAMQYRLEKLEPHLKNLGGWREAIAELEDFCHEPVRLKNMTAALNQIDELSKLLRGEV
jgi:hypothetical protein